MEDPSTKMPIEGGKTTSPPILPLYCPQLRIRSHQCNRSEEDSGHPHWTLVLKPRAAGDLLPLFTGLRGHVDGASAAASDIQVFSRRFNLCFTCQQAGSPSPRAPL